MHDATQEEEKPLITEKDGRKKGVSTLGAVWLIILAVIGSGILSIPSAVADAGWVLSIVFFILITAVSIHCCLSMCWATDLAKVLAPGSDIIGLEHIAKVVGGKWFSWFVAVCHYFDLWFNSVILLVALGTNTRAMLQDYISDAGTVSNLYRPIIGIAAAIIYPLCLAKDLKFLSRGAVVGIMSTIALLIAVVVASSEQISKRAPLPQPYECPGETTTYPAVGTPIICSLYVL